MWPLTRRGRPRSRVEGPSHSNSSSNHPIGTEPTLDHGHSESAPSSDIQKNVRGRTRLEGLWNSDANSSKKVVLGNSRGQPIGDGARELGQFLGTMVRRPRFFSFRYTDWRLVPQEDKEKVWQRVQDVFEIDSTLKEWVLQSFNKKWRDFKCQLKRTHYNPFKGDAIGAKRNCPIELEQAEWDWLVNFWESDTGKKREEKGILNRGKQSMPHTSGTKSFARRFHEETINNNGTEPSRLDMFYKLHQKKDGTFVDAIAAEKIAQLNTLSSQLPEDSQSDIAVRDKIFTQVMGEDNHGRCRMFGLGVPPKDIHGPHPTRRELKQEIGYLKNENRSLAKDVADMKEKMDILISVVGRQNGVEGDAAAILSAISKKGPGASCSRHNGNDVGSSHPDEDEVRIASADISRN